MRDGLKGSLRNGLKNGLRDGLEKMGKMREQVKKEIKCLPRGDTAQNRLRMYYWPVRMNSLKGGEEHKTSKEVLEECTKMVKQDYPDFKPKIKDKCGLK